MRLTRVNCLIHDEVQAYIRRTLVADRILSRFFENLVGFRRVQRDTGALISGSVPLQELDRALYDGSDLDIYVSRDDAATIVRFVCLCEGYERETMPIDPIAPDEPTAHDPRVPTEQDAQEPAYDFSLASTGIFEVQNFVRGVQRVQVIVTERTPLHVILNFHSSERPESIFCALF